MPPLYGGPESDWELGESSKNAEEVIMAFDGWLNHSSVAVGAYRLGLGSEGHAGQTPYVLTRMGLAYESFFSQHASAGRVGQLCRRLLGLQVIRGLGRQPSHESKLHPSVIAIRPFHEPSSRFQTS